MQQALSQGLQTKRRAVACSLVCYFQAVCGSVQSEVVELICEAYRLQAAPATPSGAEEVLVKVSLPNKLWASPDLKPSMGNFAVVEVPFQYGNKAAEEVASDIMRNTKGISQSQTTLSHISSQIAQQASQKLCAKYT
eukprot:TRINITY_DN2727_c0_g1_i4.p1 TRINITY_DN2727_c0_g1~~TRINITY_DN2727_c0_g1_i4.p1  ORF type:complete len:137 (-),score=11.79 TRINITY_DN2727_c0_g1_i4:45-455(-)